MDYKTSPENSRVALKEKENTLLKIESIFLLCVGCVVGRCMGMWDRVYVYLFAHMKD